MANFILFGANFSVYTRISRLVLEEAGTTYRLEPVDIFAAAGPPDGYLDRHPFQKIPLLEHEGFEVYETDAIVDYIVAVTGADLVPGEARARARMRQIMRIVDNYAYRRLVWHVYVREAEDGDRVPPERMTAAARVLNVLEDLMAGPFMAGATFSLADCWAWPVLAYFRLSKTGRPMIAERPKLAAWCERMATRPSSVATAFPAEK
ncbi:MAG: glutathione S-transferase family protein [Rhodospirillales bacterium]